MDKIKFNFLLSTLRSNTKSLEIIYDYYYPRIVYHLAKKYGRQFAEDIAQDFFIYLLKSEKYEYITNPTTWIYMNCDSMAKRKVGYDARYTSLSENDLVDHNEADIIFQTYGDFAEIIDKLDDIEKRIVDMYYWEGYKLKEISDITGIKYNTVKQKHKRLLKKLKKFFDVTFNHF